MNKRQLKKTEKIKGKKKEKKEMGFHYWRKKTRGGEEILSIGKTSYDPNFTDFFCKLYPIKIVINGRSRPDYMTKDGLFTEGNITPLDLIRKGNYE